jgi:urease accessory protein
MRATAVIEAMAVAGATRYRTLRSDPPLLLRPTPHALQLVGGAAGPLGGDRLAYEVTVGAGATLTVRSVAASMVLPGTEDSVLDIAVDVADGAHLDWNPQPVISVVASRHVQRTRIRLAPTATLRWSEALVLGRSGEEPGSLTSVLRVERAGTVLHHTELRIGADTPGWDGPAGLAGARAVVTEISVGPGDHATRVVTPAPGSDEATPTRAGVFALGADASVAVVTAADCVAAARALSQLARRPG